MTPDLLPARTLPSTPRTAETTSTCGAMRDNNRRNLPNTLGSIQMLVGHRWCHRHPRATLLQTDRAQPRQTNTHSHTANHPLAHKTNPTTMPTTTHTGRAQEGSEGGRAGDTVTSCLRVARAAGSAVARAQRRPARPGQQVDPAARHRPHQAGFPGTGVVLARLRSRYRPGKNGAGQRDNGLGWKGGKDERKGGRRRGHCGEEGVGRRGEDRQSD